MAEIDNVVAIKVNVQALNAEAFRPYGQVLDESRPMFAEIDPGEGRIGLELRHVKERPDTRRIAMMSVHFSYTQTFIIQSGCMVVIVAPAPGDRNAGETRYEFDYARAAAFLLQPGDAAMIYKGVCHAAFMIGPRCTYLNMTRKDHWEGTNADDEGRIDLIQQRRKYVEVIQLEKRDKRVLELDLDRVRHLISA